MLKYILVAAIASGITYFVSTTDAPKGSLKADASATLAKVAKVSKAAYNGAKSGVEKAVK